VTDSEHAQSSAALQELSFLLPAEQVETWSDALIDAGALSVQAEDADADSPDEQALYGEPGIPAVQAGWRRTRLSLLCPVGSDPRSLLQEAAQALGQDAPEHYTIADIADRDWVSASQAQFEPVPIGERLLIAPSWHPPQPGDNRLHIILDPGMAFGTGSHPTTRLCLQWLAENLRAGQSVVDYGCGSGILAIAAAKLGAGHVTGVDIDPQAILSARENARINQVEIGLALTSQGPAPAADVVVANILSNPLKVLAPLLSNLVHPGGHLVLAGLLEPQAKDVASAYPAFDMHVHAALDGWACLVGVKR
jgi:ribosomal protein L11 methyltransferase